MAKIKSHKIIGSGVLETSIVCRQSRAANDFSCAAIFNRVIKNIQKTLSSVTYVTAIIHNLFTSVIMGGAK